MIETLRTTALLLKKWWMAFAHALGWFNTRLLLTVVYVVLFALPALVLKLLRKDLLDRKLDGKSSYWTDKEKIVHTIENAKHQF